MGHKMRDRLGRALHELYERVDALEKRISLLEHDMNMLYEKMDERIEEACTKRYIEIIKKMKNNSR